MFIENRIEKKKRTDSCIEKDQRNIKGLSEKWEHTTRSLSDAKVSGGGNNSVGNEVSKETVFSTQPKQQLFAKLKQEANLKSLKFRRGRENKASEAVQAKKSIR